MLNYKNLEECAEWRVLAKWMLQSEHDLLEELLQALGAGDMDKATHIAGRVTAIRDVLAQPAILMPGE